MESNINKNPIEILEEYLGVKLDRDKYPNLGFDNKGFPLEIDPEALVIDDQIIPGYLTVYDLNSIDESFCIPVSKHYKQENLAEICMDIFGLFV